MNSPTAQTLNLNSAESLALDYVPQAHSDVPHLAVVWVHGFGSHRGGEKSLAVREMCAKRNWTFASFDFRGHGDSSGKILDLTATSLLEDLSQITGWLKQKGHSQFALVGSSMGGFASAWFAKRHPDEILALVLLAPAFQFLDRRWNSLSEQDRLEWQRTGLRRIQNEWIEADLGYALITEREQYALKKLTEHWSTPTLIFHGLADDVVPFTDSFDFLNQIPDADAELRIIKSGDHRLTAFKDEIAEESGRFISRILAKA